MNDSARLTYDDESHSYYLDGRRIISVTQALKLAGHIDARFYSAEAAARGTAVHAACEIVDGVDRRVPDAAENIEPYVDAYWKFISECRPDYAAIERMAYLESGDGAHVAGRPDRKVAALFGEAGTLEVKTGDEQDWHGYQTALYQLMEPAGSRWVVYLQKNGRYKLRRAFSADDYRIGRQAVRQAWQALKEAGNRPLDRAIEI